MGENNDSFLDKMLLKNIDDKHKHARKKFNLYNKNVDSVEPGKLY